MNDAQSLLEFFITEDTAGRGFGKQFDALFTPCDGDRAVDFIAPVSRVTKRELPPSADTAVFEVNYHVLGRLYDAGHSPVVNWSFTEEQADEVDTVRVVGNSGEHKIACGPYPGNHPGVSNIQLMLPDFPPASRRAWEHAVAGH